MYKVFFNNKTILLKQSEDEPDDEAFLHKCNERMNNILSVIWQENGPDELIFEHADLEKLYKDFESNFKLVEAAGGLVFNEAGEFLYIERHGIPDLPKGKIEKNEKIEDAAIREVSEECGINGQKIVKPLPTTFHIYEFKGKKILKKTYWFLMKYSGNEKLVPQTKEGITKVAFVDKNQASELASKSYRNLEELFGFAADYD